jgi:ribosomal protein S18 acetylase RimI-like enzyme
VSAGGAGRLVDLLTLDHADADGSERICRLLWESYAVEAKLIGVEDFAPLRRDSAQIRAAESTFYGCLREGQLVAVAEVEGLEDETANIAGFVVHPGVFRRGVGTRLLRHVLATVKATRFTVSTAAVNAPAIALYEKHGFRVRDRWTTPDGIRMVTLESRRTDRQRAG